MEFRWNEWNREKVARHGVTPAEAEQVARRAQRPYPRFRADGRYLVWGPTNAGRLRRVLYIIDAFERAYVTHARPLSAREARRWRRMRRRQP